MANISHPPLLNYCGLTIVLGKPSRFDKVKLLSGYAGQVFDGYLSPLVRESINIVCSSDYSVSSLPPATKVVLLLGDESLIHYPSYDKNTSTINDARGNPVRCENTGITFIPSYAPQDALDRKDYEGDYHNENNEEQADDENQGEADSDIKSHGVTKRRNWKWWLYNDVKKSLRLLKQGGVCKNPYDDFSIDIYPDIENVTEVLKATKGTYLYLDLETSQRQVATCFGINFSNSNNVFVVPWKKYNNLLAYDPQVARRFIQALCVAMHNNTVVCHNASFDLLVLCWRYRIPLPRYVHDTLLLWHRCYPEIEKSLGHLISYFLDLPYHKNEGGYNPKTLEAEQQLFRYNAKDIITMRLLHPMLLAEAKRLGSLDSGLRACRMLRPYLTATMRGIKLDVEKFKKRFDELDLKREQINRCLQTIVGIPTFNPRSPKQVSEYLYRDLNIPCPNLNEPTNSKTLLKVTLNHNIQSVKLISLVKKTGKLASSLKYRLWADCFTGEYDRATTGYGIGVTDTFRLGSRAIFKFKRGATIEEKLGYGTNLQNISKAQRDLVCCDYGKKLGQVDQAGAEALIVAYLCRLGKFRQLFLNGIKSHVFVGLHVFKSEWKLRVDQPARIDYLCTLTPPQLKADEYFNKVVKPLIASSDEWPAKERYYFIAKMVCHAANYGMKAPTFQTNVLEKSEGAIVLTRGQCEAFLTLYHGLFPEIHEWHLDVRNTLMKTRVLKNLFDEPRRFNGAFDDELWKSAYAFVPQSTVGQITNIAFTEIQEGLDDRKIDSDRSIGLELLQNNHDSILFQFNDGQATGAFPIVTAAMNRRLVSPRGEEFFMRTECQSGKNWRPFKRTYNEEGLVEYKV